MFNSLRSNITVTDQFCGAGGSSQGATTAGAEVKLAMNHWQLAIETHNSNFPETDHHCADIHAADPRYYYSTDILITSPECTNHSLAKGQKRINQAQLGMFEPTINLDEERSRATMWDVVRFAEVHNYRVIIVENVVDVRHWRLWDNWINTMKALGYEHECVYFNSQFAHLTPGRPFVPQSRDRIYVVFWKKGNKKPNLDFRPVAYCPHCGCNVEAVQIWKNPQKKWGKYKSQYNYHCPNDVKHGAITPYYYGAWTAVDWSIPTPIIGERKKPLKERTIKRIELGLEKFKHQPIMVLNYTPGYSIPVVTPLGSITTNDHHALVTPPFIVNPNYTHGHDRRATSVGEPFPTQDTKTRPYLLVPTIFNNQSNADVVSASQPLNTILAGGNHKWLLTLSYQNPAADSAGEPMPTLTTKEKTALVTVPNSFTFTYSNGSGPVRDVVEPLHTLTTWIAEGLVKVGDVPKVDECGYRMLEPHEIGRGMAFPDTYTVLGTKEQKVRQYGNAVTPPVMENIMERVMATFH